MQLPTLSVLAVTAISSTDAAAWNNNSIRSVACAPPSSAVPFLRAYSGSAHDHFYTTDSAEMNNAVANLGYSSEGTSSYIYTSTGDGTTALYRLYNAGTADHFYTTSASEASNAVAHDGYALEGIAGYIYADAGCGGVPFYRLWNSQGADHFYTTSASERDNANKNIGYAEEGVAGYVLPA